MNYLSQFRAANPDLQGFSDDQIVEALPQLLPERFGGKPMSQVRAEVLLAPEELEIRQYEQQGGGIGSSIERGLLRVNQTFNAAGAALGDAVMGALPESWQQSHAGQWLQGQADQDKQDVVRDQQRMSELPQRPEMMRAIEAANNAETGMGAIGAFAKEVWDSPDTAGFLVDTLAEQVPVIATMALGTKGAGGVFGTSSALGRAATFGTGAGIGSGSTTFGSNVAEAMGQDISKFDEATDYAFKRSLAQAIVDGTVGAVVPFKIGGNQIVNIPTQAVLQAAGGATGEYAGGAAVGEEVSKGELVAEGLLELLSLPANLAMANIEYFNSKRNPVGDANARINAAGDQVAAAGGDALAQESAKAQAASSEIPGAVSEAKTIADTLKVTGQVSAADLGIQIPEQPDWSQFDTAPGTESRVSLEPRQAEQPAPRQSARDMSGLDGLIITADRMGFADEAAMLRTSQRLYKQAEDARTGNDADRYFSLIDRADRLYREATETNDQVREIADQFPVPYVATGEIEGGEVGPYRGPGRTGETFDQPRSVGGPAALEQQRTNRLNDSGIIFGEELDYAKAQRQAMLPPGTGQINMGRDRPQQGIQQPQAGYEGIGRNAVERTAQAKTSALPAGNATRAITPQQYRQIMDQARLAMRTPVSRRTPEMQQAVAVREQVRAGEIEVTEAAQPEVVQGEVVTAVDRTVAAPDLRMKANGEPFTSERSAQASAAFRDNRDFATVVPIDGGYAVRVDTQAQNEADTQAVEQQQARSEQAKTRMYREPDPVNDDMLDAIALLGGIDRAEAEAEGIDPAVFNRRAAGIRPIFTRQNGDSFDGMAERLAQYGYLDPRTDRLDDLRAKLDQAINGGRKIMTPEGYEALAEKELAAEAQLQEEHAPLADDITSDEAWAGEAYAMAAEAGVPINVIDAILEQYNADPIATLVELNDAINEVENARAAQAGEGTQGRSADTEIPWNEPGNLTDADISAIFGEPEQDAEPLLTSYTESDLQAQADAQSAADQTEADAQRRAEQKAQADAEVNDFTLSGSNRPADVAASRGQNDMFGLGGTPRTEPAAAQTETPKQAAQQPQGVDASISHIRRLGAKKPYFEVSVWTLDESGRQDEMLVRRQRAESESDAQLIASENGYSGPAQVFRSIWDGNRQLAYAVSGELISATQDADGRVVVDFGDQAGLRTQSYPSVTAADDALDGLVFDWPEHKDRVLGELDSNRVNTASMNWNQLKAEASERGVYRVGMTKEQVVEALNTVPSGPSSSEVADQPAPQQAEPTLQPIESAVDAVDDLNQRINNGETVTAAEVRRVFEYVAGNQETVKAELNKLKKDDLKRLVNGHVWSDTKKAELVDRAYDSLIGDFRFIGNESGVITSTGFGAENRLNQAREHVNALTDEQVAEYAKNRKAMIDERMAERKQRIDALKDPQTLQEYRESIRILGMDKLTPEQRATYDRLVAEETMAQRQPQSERAGLQTDEQVELGEPTEGTHGKTGETIFNVKVITRLGKEKFKEAAGFARSMGGGYFRGTGSFYFKTREDAEMFSGWVNGDSVDLTDRNQQRQEKKQANAADKLKAMADRIEQQANEALNADRKENTLKRMGEGERARAKANRELSIAAVLKAIPDSDTVVLKNATQKVQIELLDTLARSLVHYAPEEQLNKDSYSRRTFKDEVTPEQQVQHARMPLTAMSVNAIRELANNMLQVKGYVVAARGMLKGMQGRRPDEYVNFNNQKTINKVLEFVENHSDQYSPLRDAAANYKRLQRMGITSPPLLRTALLEYMALRDSVTESNTPNRLQTLERDLQRTIVGNRNAFNDFFPTPEAVAEEVVAQAEIEPGMRVLEPSAGNGMLADAAKAAGAEVDVVEMGGQLREILSEKGYTLVGDDFLEYQAGEQYDRIVMNPPFSKDQDIEHVSHAYDQLKPGGKLVAIVSSMAGDRANTRNRQFREWLDSLDAVEQPLPQGAFLSSMNQTGVNTKVLVIEKPMSEQDAQPATGVETVPEATLEDMRFLQKWGDHWQYALSPGRNWMTANSKEDAVKRATDRYWKTPEDERLTNDQRAQKADAEEAADMDFRYGRRSKEQIEQEIDRLNRRITEHQRVARREISGTDGRRTAPAVAAEGARTATEELMRLNRYYESKFGGNTVTAQGITIEVPTIDQQLVDDYNRATHMGRGRDLNAELRSEAEGLLNELSERQYTLDTPEQKTEAKRLIEAYLQAQAEFSQWDARYSANNPSWIVTGRSGRNMDKSNRANERHMDEYTKRVDRLQAQRDRIGDTLYKMRPQEVQENQALSADLRSITQQAGHILGYLEEGKKALVSETRKWASPKAHKLIERSLEADHGRTIEHIRELENTKAVQDAGGLVKVFGPRSKAGKLVNELLNEQTPQFSRRPQTETEAFRNWFGDSKVVDGNGDPLVVYHGTIGDFSEFSIKEYGTNFTGDYGVGFYFTQDPKTASGYADSADFIASHKSGESGGANVMPAYLKMENPLIVKKSFGTGDLWKKVPGAKTKQELTDGLISQGYDGVIVDGGRSGYRYISEAVVFSPNQIKSATGNNGNFDPNNPDIRFSPRNEVTSENTATEGNTNEGIDQLNEALQKAGETATARSAVLDTLTGGKRQAAEFAEALASAFGQTITWVQTDTALFDGVTVNGQLFVDVDSSVPYHIVMGHELTHILRNEHPDLYAQLESLILPDATARAESAEFHRFEEGSAKANEEYVADVVGNRFGERKFWADMAATEPGFFRRVAAIVRSLIQRVTDQFKSDRTLYGDAVKDLNRVRNQVAGVMMEYRRRQKAMSAQEFRQSQTGDLRFSLRDRIRRGGDAETGAFAVPEETWANVALRKMADKFQVLKDLQKNIQDAGGTVNESNDAYLAEELFHGKTEEDLRQMRETFIKPLADKMAKFGIEQKDLDQYLYAKHAPERNAHIAEINPELQEAGSGMSDAKAAEIIQQARESGKLEQYEQLAGMVYDMLETRRETIRSAGLEEGGMIDAWESKYEFYVPLKGWAVDEKQDSMARTGSGFNIAGKESKRALGRSSEAASPSSYAIQDLTETLIRRRKNEVGNTLLNLVQDNPNKGYWQVFTNESPDMDRQVFRSETEASKQARAAARKAGQPEPDRQYQETVRETPIPMAMMSDKYFQTKRNGQTYFIKLEDERLMKAMKNIGPDTSNFLIRKLGAVNRVLSSLNTSYNPEFVVGNFARDVQTAVLNLMAEQSRDDGKVLGEKIAKQTVKDIPKAMKAVYRGLRNKDEATGGEWQKWFSEFREAGAKTGWFDMKDIDGQADDLQSLISMAKGGVKGNAMKWFKATGQMVEDLNGAVENAVRLSAYVNARKAGISQAKAASLAKNMTVNFNRRGEVGTTLNALYMFANASIQGSMNFARTMIGLKGQKGDPIWQRLNTAQKVAAGLVMGSYAIAMANRAGAGEDDDGENWYDKVPDYVKERNLVIMKSLLGGEQDGSYWTIPLPYGYNIFHVLGNAMEGTTNGNTSIGKAATDLTLATLGSFSPIGFQESQTLSGTIARNLTPTLGKPIADIVANENFMGTSIYNENFPFGTPKPDSQLGRRSTPEGYKAIAEFLNEVSGGSQWRSGYIDINPDVMRYAVNYFTGAAGKFVLDKAPSNLYHLATLTPIESREALFYSRISGKVLPYADREKFYTRRDEVNQAEAEWKGLTGGDRVRFYRDNRQLLALRPLIQSTEKQLKSLRQQRDRIYAMNLPRKEQEERMERVEARMKRIIDRFNRQYKQATSDD